MRALLTALVLVFAAASVRAEEASPSPAEDAPKAPESQPEVAPAPVEAPPAAEPPAPLESSVTGYLDSRFVLQHPKWDGLLPTTNLPIFMNITEANFQLKLTWGDKARVYADTSFFYQGGGEYWQADPDGNWENVGAHDVNTLRPLAVISELYALYRFGEHAHLTVGKTRIVWGPGFAVNSTDLLNPPKDPTDPTFQRAGSWLARLELPFDTWTFSLVGAVKATRQYGGLPAALLYYPDYPSWESKTYGLADDRDLQPHFAVAARLYALKWETDFNAFWYFTNLYNDAFDHKHRGGFSASHTFGGWEVHAEALFQLGSQRQYYDGDCTKGSNELLACVRSGKAIVARSRLEDTNVVPKVLAGARYTFEDNSFINLEYYWNEEGYTKDEFQAFLQLVTTGKELAKLNPAMGAKYLGLLLAPSGDPGSPQKFSFDPYRRHYAFLTYSKPQLYDDFTVNVVLLVGLEDLSGQLAPSLTWSVREWFQLVAGAFVTIPGPDALAIDAGGQKFTEYGILPGDVRGYLSARVFY